MTPEAQIERSIITKFRKLIWRPFTKGVRDYALIEAGDKIAVCISGGKDSMLLAKCIQELQKHGRIPFQAVFLAMDPGYNVINRNKLEDNAHLLGIPLYIFSAPIFDVVSDSGQTGSPCYLCARMRRGYLYSNAQKLGCNKIALGHHFDDVIETTLLNVLYGGELKAMMPKLHSKNFAGMELIRPLYLVKEADIVAWRNYNGLRFLGCACRFTENCVIDDGGGTKRPEIKALIRQFRATSPRIEHNIFKSMENVHIGAVLGTRKNGSKRSFLEDY
jgi:tRNA(Ile)-lysidine synthase TilS/MesJ